MSTDKEKKTNPLLDEDQDETQEETQENQATKDSKSKASKSKPKTKAKAKVEEKVEEVKEEEPEAEAEGEDDPELDVDPEVEAEEEPLKSEEVKSSQSFPQAQSREDIGIEYGKMTKDMKEHLAKQPKVAFLIPLSEGEKNGAFETVQINGYRMVIKKGTMVQIPQQVAEILADHYRISSEAGQDYRIDRDSKVKDALS